MRDAGVVYTCQVAGPDRTVDGAANDGSQTRVCRTMCAVRLVLASHPRTDTAAPISTQYLRFGSSPRGAQTMVLAAKVRALTRGRFNASFDDIEAVAAAALRHRLILNFEAEAEGITTDHILAQLLRDVPRDAAAVAV